MRMLLAIIDTVLPYEENITSEQRQKIMADVEQLLRRQLEVAPTHVAIGLKLLTGAFAAVTFVCAHGRLFSSLPRGKRCELVGRWSKMLGLFDNYIRCYSGLSALAYFEHPIMLQRFQLPSGSEHQRKSREARDCAVARGLT